MGSIGRQQSLRGGHSGSIADGYADPHGHACDWQHYSDPDQHSECFGSRHSDSGSFGSAIAARRERASYYDH